jgi:hypothetical protein
MRWVVIIIGGVSRGKSKRKEKGKKRTFTLAETRIAIFGGTFVLGLGL